MANKVVAYYLRVSTNRQEKEETIDSQRAEVEGRIKEDGNILPGNLKFEDDGWSGDLLARPGLDSMRDAAKRKAFEILYVYDLGRLSRNFMNQLILIDEIKNFGIELVSLHDINPENDEQTFAQNVMGLFHDYERKKIVERMRRGKLYKAKLGKYMNLQAPYGYTYIPKNKDKDPYLIINDEEANIIGKIFKWVGEEGLTIRRVIKRLHDLKLYPRKRYSSSWSNGPICRLLRNEVYIGRAYYNKSFAKVPINPLSKEQYRKTSKTSRGRRPRDEWIPLEVPAIVDKDLFYRVQEQIRNNQRYNKRNRQAPFLLTGKVFCICGNRRIGEGVREHKYYRCTDRIHRFPLPRQCEAPGVNAFHLDYMIWDKVSSLVTKPALIKQQAEKWMENKNKSRSLSQIEVENLQKLLKKLEDEEKRYIKAYGAGLLTLTQFKERAQELKERKAMLQEEIEKASARKDTPTFDMREVKDLDEKAKEVLNGFNLDERRVFLREVLHGVTVGDANRVLVKGHIPVGKEVQNVKFWTISRNSGVAK